jgi:hypothetical protein
MSMSLFQKYDNELFPDPLISGFLEQNGKLLKTIYVPKNIMNVTDRLPQAAYDENTASKISLLSTHSK